MGTWTCHFRIRYFYPRPPRGGRRIYSDKGISRIDISIHALREEGDATSSISLMAASIFLSTPSARRATRSGSCRSPSQKDFYPRPPRGGRPKPSKMQGLRSEFLSTPSARRATVGVVDVLGAHTLFLSTPSARRATAKTERKHPAFVSLYTSLHKLQRDACKPNRKITPLLAQTAGIPVRSVPENHVCCRFALAGHQKISTLSWANFGCSPTCSTLVW